MTENAREVEVRGAVEVLVATVQGTITLGNFSSSEAAAIWTAVKNRVGPWILAQQRGSM